MFHKGTGVCCVIRGIYGNYPSFFAVNTKLPMLSVLVSKDFTAEKLCLPTVEFSLMIIDSTFLLLEKFFDVNIDYIVNFVLIIKKDYLQPCRFRA